MKIIDYKIVAYNYYSEDIMNDQRICYLNDFIELINKEINNGWQPYGDMKIPLIEGTIPKLIQVMVKYDNGENNE